LGINFSEILVALIGLCMICCVGCHETLQVHDKLKILQGFSEIGHNKQLFIAIVGGSYFNKKSPL